VAKRLTATEKWVDPWFCGLTVQEKLFWIFIVDNCNHAGIWKVNWPLVNFYIKDFVFNEDNFNGRILKLKDDKWFIPKFIEFQYGVLNPENRLHLSVINILKKEGAYKGLNSPLQGLKDNNKRKNKDKDKGKRKNIPPTLLDISSYFKEIDLPDGEVGKFYDHYQANGWRQSNGLAIKDWRAAARNWGRRMAKPAKSEKPQHESPYDKDGKVKVDNITNGLAATKSVK